MRLLYLMIVMAIGCGPSTKEVQSARDARYRGPAVRIFDIAETVTKETYKIAESDPAQLALITLPKWYGPDGQSESAGTGDAVIVQDGSLLVALLVRVEADAEDIPDPDREAPVKITVTPVVERLHIGQSTNEKLAPDDPSMPGWVTGKAEALLVSIHARAKEHLIAP